MDPTHLDLLSREYGFHFPEITHTDINSSPPGQNGRHFPDDIFRCIFVNEKFCILIKITLTFLPKVGTDNNPAMV